MQRQASKPFLGWFS